MRFFALPLAAATLVTAATLSSEEIAQKADQGLALLRFAENVDPVWHTEDERLDFLRNGTRFMDVTFTWERKQKLKAAKKPKAAEACAGPTHVSAVNAILKTVSTSNMQSTLTSLTAFNNRYYRASTGAQASTFIRDTVAKIISGRSDASVALYSHSWTQSSIIAKIAGTAATTPVTIIGAHMDSINLNSPTSGRAPGADDDGTGAVNLIEALRALIASGYKPKTPVEFHWYSGEEAGLLGSQDVAASYAEAGVKVQAFMEVDMSGYFKKGTTEVFALQADYISTALNKYLGTLIDEYSAFGWTMDKACGYACSDHASWYEQGYPTTFPYEAVTGNDNPQIHSSSDTTSVSGFSWTHSLEFAKIVVAFAYELAPPA
ncbi:Zn-dependent exopeptidase [Cylindrobasidium torrendii FP15055 ss-10]|uniref:Peptide hydrolase n=1 Tax=Cylindrobasidium torrendii FP15055 ss-10 TaxID=1314674 RepID=A0A0D7BQH8_9AGAR|nr:Zn-dependent exopeptidase [Cylindrobasidium torrendii FP15055 ss-10]